MSVSNGVDRSYDGSAPGAAVSIQTAHSLTCRCQPGTRGAQIGDRDTSRKQTSAYISLPRSIISVYIPSWIRHLMCIGTHVRASLELRGAWRLMVTHSLTALIENRKVFSAMSSGFSW